MAFKMIFLAFSLGLVAFCNGKSLIDDLKYLHKFGYLSSGRSQGNSLRNAILKYQGFSNLPQTGILDDQTRKQMNVPRCGVKDSGNALISVWKKKALSYRFESFTNDLPKSTVRRVIADAFKVWSDASQLSFNEVSTNSKSDLVIGFSTGKHGDAYPFDGPGVVLAHAFFPSDGRIHFDDDETFVDSPSNTHTDTDLLWVAAHEIGHALGLQHSNDNTALMYPYYQQQTGKLTLPSADRAEINRAYRANCQDSYGHCDHYVQQGDCYRKESLMRQNCEKSCGFCF